MEEKTICTECGCIIEQGDEVYEVNGEVICEYCANDTIVCDYCGNRVWEENSVNDDNTFLCQSCYEDHYQRCECCRNIIRNYNTFWHNDTPYCPNCYDNRCDEIEEYSYKPDPVFKGEGNMYFGVELEVDEGGKDDDNACRIKDIANMHTENIYIKADGSLEDGFEIVSHPMTLDYHMYEMDWEAVMHEAVNLGYRSHKSDTCGLHIHVNRDAFGKNESEQEEVISRILFFVEKHWNEIFRFSRRSHYNMDRWLARYGFEKTAKEILEKAKSGEKGRYTAINLKNYYTIEFRLFRGTLKYNTFIATLQMVNKICNVAFSMTEEEIDNMSWSSFVSIITETELIQYLKERQLYVNEKVCVEEDF